MEILDQFISFASRLAPAIKQKDFGHDLRKWTESLSEEERQKLIEKLMGNPKIMPQTLPPGLRQNARGLSRYCILIARNMLELFNKKTSNVG